MRKTTILRKRLKEKEILLLPSVYDVLGAKCVEEAGFEVVGVSSMSLEATLLGTTDTGMYTLTELANVCSNIASAVDIPVFVDAETGFGNALNVIRLVKELERAGCAGMLLEDQVTPKKCPLIREERPIIPVEEMVGKIRAARDALEDKDFLIMARTDATGEEETLRRAKIYLEAGADIIGPIWGVAIHRGVDGHTKMGPDLETMKRYREEIDAPMRGIDMPVKTLEELGYDIAWYPSDAVRTTAKALIDYMKELKEERHPIPERMMSLSDFIEFIGAPRYRKLEDKYIRYAKDLMPNDK